MPNTKKTRTYEEQDGGINANVKKIATRVVNSTPTGRIAKIAYNQVAKKLPPGAIQGKLGSLAKKLPPNLQGKLGSLTKKLPPNLQGKLGQLSNTKSPLASLQGNTDIHSRGFPETALGLSENMASTQHQLNTPITSDSSSAVNTLITTPSSSLPAASVDMPNMPSPTSETMSTTFSAAENTAHSAVDNAELYKLESEIARLASQQPNQPLSLPSAQLGGASLVEIGSLRTNAEALLTKAKAEGNPSKIAEIERDLSMINTLAEISEQNPTLHTISEIKAKLNDILVHATERNDTTLKNHVLSDLEKLDKLEQKTASTSKNPLTPSIAPTLPSNTTPEQFASKFARMFPLLTGVIAYILFEFKIPSNTTLFFAICALILVLSSMILSLTYLIILAKESANSKLISNPLNLQSPDYNISKSIQFFGSEYKYQLFIIIPILAILCSGFALYYSIKFDPRQSGLVKGIVIGCLIQSLIALILNSLSYSYGRKRLHAVNNRINDLNNYIHNKIYKNAEFLASLKEIPHDSLSASHIVKKALSNIEHNSNVNTIANAFFTLNLYYHYQKIGFRNDYITDAMNIFDIHSLFKGSSFKDRINFMNSISQAAWSPVDFLFRKTSFIEDRSQDLKNTYFQIYGNATHPKRVDLAINEVSKWLDEINARSNMINPQDSWKGFITMAILILVIQTAPLLLIIYLYQKYNK